MKRHAFTIAFTLLFASGLLVGCGAEDEKRAIKAAEWLQDTAAMRQMPKGWTVKQITAKGSDGVEMEIHLSSPEQENAIRGIAQMKRFAAVQVACPQPEDEIWTLLSSDHKLWLKLIGASGTQLTTGTCWRQSHSGSPWKFG